jgi:hypothetical protein
MRCGVYSNGMKSEMLLGGDMAALQLFDLSRSQVLKEVRTTTCEPQEDSSAVLMPFPSWF